MKYLLSGLFSCVLMLNASVTLAEEGRVLSGTVDLKKTDFGFIIKGSVGKGTLQYRGKSYEFEIGGLGAGGVGVSESSVRGEVYDLKKLEDFSGTYSQVRAGGAVARKGKSVLSLSNGKGVSMDLRGNQEGVALNTGADGLTITLK
jgi:hypothetical protein